MSRLEKGVENCSTAAITRVLSYYRERGMKRFPDEKALYAVIKEIAVKYGYTAKNGTNFTKIDNILSGAFSAFNYSGKAKSIYIWDFDTVRKEIDRENPLILNIAFGKYRDHTVTVVGYFERTVRKGAFRRRERMLEIYDGWSEDVRVLDFNTLGIASFTVAEPGEKE